jgi:SAM-dependent methyltransferase
MTAADATRRKRLGAWYTPPALVDAVVAEVCRNFLPRTVLDPACGDGAFLRPFESCAEVTGVDVDPFTAFVHDDSLRRDWGDQHFDAVVGNPPFLSQLSAATSRGGRSRFGGGPYADAAAEFLALAMRLARPGGRVGLVLPISLLGARDAATIRADVDARAALRWMWWSDAPMFDAAVRVWAGVWEVGGAPGTVRRAFGPRFEERPAMAMPSAWTGLIAQRPLPDVPADAPRLGDIARFTADFRDQYYGLVGAVSDDGDGPPLITSGLIEPNEVLWGQRPVTFAKQRYHAPRVQLDKLAPPMRAWAAGRLVPKILIASQTKRIEAVHDGRGEWLPGVPVITCTTSEPDRLMAALHHPLASDWLRYHAAGTGLSAGTIRVSAAALTATPVFG